MVPVSTTSDFLLADARAALRRRVSDAGRTELSRAFAAWLLRETEADAEFASLVSEAAARQGAQQDFQTVAILGFGADAGILGAEQIEALKKGLRRQAGREVVIDGLPVAFCSDAVGILGVALGTKAVADTDLTERVVKWASKFLKNSYDAERTEDWHRCLFAAGNRQLGSPLNLSVPKSPAMADVRTALVARGLMDSGDDNQAAEDDAQTLRLAIREPQNELNCDQAALRLAAVESVIRAATPEAGGKNVARSAKRSGPLSDRDISVHDTIGKERFTTLTNAQIMKEPSVKKRLRVDCSLAPGDAAKRCLDRIRQAKGYPLSREVQKNGRTGNKQRAKTVNATQQRPFFSITSDATNGQPCPARFTCQRLKTCCTQQHSSRAMF